MEQKIEKKINRKRKELTACRFGRVVLVVSYCLWRVALRLCLRLRLRLHLRKHLQWHLRSTGYAMGQKNEQK